MQLNKYIGHTITGEHLNVILEGMPLLKFMNDDDKHFGMKYETGYNLDILPFNGKKSCQPGGIYVTTLLDHNEYIKNYGSWARRVFVQPNALVYIENCKIKCDEVILGKRVPKKELISELIIECGHNGKHLILAEIIKKTPNNIQFIEQKYRTLEMMMCAIEQDPLTLQFIEQKYRTLEMMMCAIEQDPLTLQFIEQKYRTLEMMMCAIEQDPLTIQFIEQEYRTHEMIINAIKNDPCVLSLIEQEYRTEEMMLSAIKEFPDALSLIAQNYRTPEMIMIALKQNRHAIIHIPYILRTDQMMDLVNQQNYYNSIHNYYNPEFDSYDFAKVQLKDVLKTKNVIISRKCHECANLIFHYIEISNYMCIIIIDDEYYYYDRENKFIDADVVIKDNNKKILYSFKIRDDYDDMYYDKIPEPWFEINENIFLEPNINQKDDNNFTLTCSRCELCDQCKKTKDKILFI